MRSERCICIRTQNHACKAVILVVLYTFHLFKSASQRKFFFLESWLFRAAYKSELLKKQKTKLKPTRLNMNVATRAHEILL